MIAGGMLAGKYLSKHATDSSEKGGRYDKNTLSGQIYSAFYVKDDVFEAVRLLNDAAASSRTSRWHS